MNKIGMAIDCSHVGVQTTLDVIEYSTPNNIKPCWGKKFMEHKETNSR